MFQLCHMNRLLYLILLSTMCCTDYSVGYNKSKLQLYHSWYSRNILSVWIPNYMHSIGNLSNTSFVYNANTEPNPYEPRIPNSIFFFNCSYHSPGKQDTSQVDAFGNSSTLQKWTEGVFWKPAAENLLAPDRNFRTSPRVISCLPILARER